MASKMDRRDEISGNSRKCPPSGSLVIRTNTGQTCQQRASGAQVDLLVAQCDDQIAGFDVVEKSRDRGEVGTDHSE
jgi:hypothetical protein